MCIAQRVYVQWFLLYQRATYTVYKAPSVMRDHSSIRTVIHSNLSNLKVRIICTLVIVGVLCVIHCWYRLHNMCTFGRSLYAEPSYMQYTQS
jgi:predicted ABC-type sugar transport system permease subunit